jgi:hypothetical protein
MVMPSVRGEERAAQRDAPAEVWPRQRVTVGIKHELDPTDANLRGVNNVWTADGAERFRGVKIEARFRLIPRFRTFVVGRSRERVATKNAGDCDHLWFIR